MQITKQFREGKILTPTAYVLREGHNPGRDTPTDSYYLEAKNCCRSSGTPRVYRLYRELQDLH